MGQLYSKQAIGSNPLSVIGCLLKCRYALMVIVGWNLGKLIALSSIAQSNGWISMQNLDPPIKWRVRFNGRACWQSSENFEQIPITPVPFGFSQSNRHFFHTQFVYFSAFYLP